MSCEEREHAFLPSVSQERQNAYGFWIFRWRMVLVRKTTVHDPFWV
jgi:hypothetical protein